MSTPTCPLCECAMERSHQGAGVLSAGVAWLGLGVGALLSVCAFPVGLAAGALSLLFAIMVFSSRRSTLTCDGCGYTVDRVGGGGPPDTPSRGPLGGRSLSERLIHEPERQSPPSTTTKQR